MAATSLLLTLFTYLSALLFSDKVGNFCLISVAASRPNCVSCCTAYLFLESGILLLYVSAESNANTAFIVKLATSIARAILKLFLIIISSNFLSNEISYRDNSLFAS
jgi:hypothetical protein